MEFRLEPWEFPPGADANNLSVPIEFGPVEWNGAQTLISARWLELDSDEALAFFRPHAGAINYVVTHDDGTPVWVWKKHINSKFLGNIVRTPQENHSCYGRSFYCNGDYLLFRDGFGYWASQDIWQQEAPLQIPFDWTIESSERIFQWLQEQWQISSSEVRFFWEWNRKNEQERNLWLGEFVPRWNELRDLMLAASIVADLPTGRHWMLPHINTHSHSPELLARLQPWRELFEAEFSFEPLSNSYPQFLRNYFQMASSHVQVEGAESSAHQQLEARLFLRDWLQHNAPEHLHLIQ